MSVSRLRTVASASASTTAALSFATISFGVSLGTHSPCQNEMLIPGTPKEIVAKLNAAVVDALAEATVRKRLTDIGQEIFPRDKQTPETLYAFHKAEIDKWWPIIKAAGIKAE